MRSARRLFVGSLAAAAVAVAASMLATPAALAGTCKLALVFQVQPTTTQVQTAMAPPVVVYVENSRGYLVSSYDGPVSLTYAVNEVGAPEPANNIVDAVHGVATFPALTFSAVGFGFELQASAKGSTSSPSQPFNIVGQLVHCQPGQSCQSGTVSSAGTSGSAVAGAAATSDILTATGGGFPRLSCTGYGGVLTFTVTNRSKIITLTLAPSPAPSPAWQAYRKYLPICWGSPTPFITKNGSTSQFYAPNDEYEGLLPYCRWGGPSPCIASQRRKYDGAVVTIVRAPLGDPRMSY
jgi:hypothetical protein